MRAELDVLSKVRDIQMPTKDCESKPNPAVQGEALTAPCEETCNRGQQGLVTHAVVVISARDMSVSPVIDDHPL